jgi:hypothetical protein
MHAAAARLGKEWEWKDGLLDGNAAGAGTHLIG